jgi:hypothetical protein
MTAMKIDCVSGGAVDEIGMASATRESLTQNPVESASFDSLLVVPAEHFRHPASAAGDVLVIQKERESNRKTIRLRSLGRAQRISQLAIKRELQRSELLENVVYGIFWVCYLAMVLIALTR